MKAKYIVTNPLYNEEIFTFRSRYKAIQFAYEMANYFSLVTEVVRKPNYTSGNGKILLYADGRWRRI